MAEWISVCMAEERGGRMNHDAAHCLDYKKNQCPKTCYRAQLTEELRNMLYPLPTSWVHFKGTQYCPKWKEVKA